MIKFNYQRGLAPIVLILIIMVLVGIVGGGVYYYKIQDISLCNKIFTKNPLVDFLKMNECYRKFGQEK